MPYVPKNLFPRNTSISNNGEYVSFLGNIDEHDYIENVYLNLYNEKGQLVAKVNNANETADYPLAPATNIDLNLGTSTKPPYDYTNTQIKLDIPTSSGITIKSVEITNAATDGNRNITITLTDNQTDAKSIPIVFTLKTYYPWSLKDGTWHELSKQEQCTLYGACIDYNDDNKYHIKSMKFKVVFDNYVWQENTYYLNGFYTFIGKNDKNTDVWTTVFYSGNAKWRFEGFNTIEDKSSSLKFVTFDISYYLNQDKVNWSFTLEGKYPDVFIQEGTGVSSELISEKVDGTTVQSQGIIIESGEFVESGQYFNGIQFKVLEGTEYFYFLEILPVQQKYISGEYNYTITFPRALLPSSSLIDTCQLTLGTNIIPEWTRSSSTILKFTSPTPYLTPKTNTTMSIAVELKRIKTKLLSINRNDFKTLVENNKDTLSELHYIIMSKTMSSPIASYKNISNFDNNLIYIERLNTKQCRVYSSYVDTFFTHTKFTLQDANGKVVSIWELDQITLDEIIDNLSNQEYTLVVEYALKNGLSNIQEITIPIIEPSTIDPYAIIVEYDAKRQANKIEVPYYTTTNGATTYISIYKKTYKDGALCNQTLVLSNQTMSEKPPSLSLYDYGISFGHAYEYEVLYTVDELVSTTNGSESTIQESNSTTDGSESTANNDTIKKYYESKPSALLTIEDWVGTALYGVKYDYDNNDKNRYELDSDNVWYFDLDTQSNTIDFTNERNIFLNLSPIPKVGVSSANYMTQSITTKLGYLDENDIYVGDNGWKLNKFAEWANDGFIKILRLRNGYLIPVDIQLKNNTINYSALGEPSDITFTWTQVKDHRITSLYSFVKEEDV